MTTATLSPQAQTRLRRLNLDQCPVYEMERGTLVVSLCGHARLFLDPDGGIRVRTAAVWT